MERCDSDRVIFLIWLLEKVFLKEGFIVWILNNMKKLVMERLRGIFF